MRPFNFSEIEDQEWLPGEFRNMITELLKYHISDMFKIYDSVVPKIIRILQYTGESQIVDLCSGASGPWPLMVKYLKPNLKVVLTDRYPNLKAWSEIASKSHGRITYVDQPVDAMCIPEDLKGLRTLFTGFHHFKPEAAKEILKKAVQQNQPIAVFEFTGRKFSNMLGMFWSPLLVYLSTPFVKPKKMERFLWTYIVPVIPFLYWWDGIVSNLNTYSPEELKSMVNEIDSDGYKWEIGTETSREPFFTITYLIGYREKNVDELVKRGQG